MKQAAIRKRQEGREQSRQKRPKLFDPIARGYEHNNGKWKCLQVLLVLRFWSAVKKTLNEPLARRRSSPFFSPDHPMSLTERTP